MKRILTAAGALLLISAPAFTAINSNDPGLPDSWNTSSTQGWPAITGQAGNGGSAMCVECHSVNPSPHITNPSSRSSGFTIGTGVGNTANWGSHTVKNNLFTIAFATYSSMSGGFTGGFGGAAPTPAGKYMMKVTWNTNGTAGLGMSKVDTGGAAPASTLASAVGTWGNQGMICESCHNIVANQGASLLLGTYGDNQADTLCVLCHDGGTDQTASYAAFHGGDNLPAFNPANRKRHHVLTGDTLGFYGTTGSDSLMWAPTFSDKIGTGTYGTFVMSQTLTPTSPIQWRGLNNVTGAGSRSTPLTTSDIVQWNNNSTITCSNCHRPHNARTQAGAFILRLGDSTVTATSGGDFPGRQAGAVTNTSWQGGMRRQRDVGDWTTTKVYGEYIKLCVGCHYGYGQ